MMVLLRGEGDEGFDRRDIELGRKFSLLASHALAALSANRSESERKRLHQLTEQLEAAQATLTHRANHDMLTGLPNRAYFEERVTSRSEEHTSELQSLLRNSYAVSCLKKTKTEHATQL